MKKIKMKWTLNFSVIERSIIQDKNFVYTIVSYFAVLAIFINLNGFQSPLIGSMASIMYFVINTIFLGNTFFEKESTFFRLMWGVLLLIMLIGFFGWLTLVIYNLDATRVTFVLLVVATFSSLFNRRMKHRNATA